MPSNSYYPEDETPPGDSGAAELEGAPPEAGDTENETFLVSKTALGADVQVGDERKIKVVAILEDEAECEVVKEEAEAEPMSGMEGARNRLRAGAKTVPPVGE